MKLFKMPTNCAAALFIFTILCCCFSHTASQGARQYQTFPLPPQAPGIFPIPQQQRPNSFQPQPQKQQQPQQQQQQEGVEGDAEEEEVPFAPEYPNEHIPIGFTLPLLYYNRSEVPVTITTRISDQVDPAFIEQQEKEQQRGSFGKSRVGGVSLSKTQELFRAPLPPYASRLQQPLFLPATPPNNFLYYFPMTKTVATAAAASSTSSPWGVGGGGGGSMMMGAPVPSKGIFRVGADDGGSSSSGGRRIVPAIPAYHRMRPLPPFRTIRSSAPPGSFFYPRITPGGEITYGIEPFIRIPLNVTTIRSQPKERVLGGTGGPRDILYYPQQQQQQQGLRRWSAPATLPSRHPPTPFVRSIRSNLPSSSPSASSSSYPLMYQQPFNLFPKGFQQQQQQQHQQGGGGGSAGGSGGPYPNLQLPPQGALQYNSRSKEFGGNWMQSGYPFRPPPPQKPQGFGPPAYPNPIENRQGTRQSGFKVSFDGRETSAGGGGGVQGVQGWAGALVLPPFRPSPQPPPYGGERAAFFHPTAGGAFGAAATGPTFWGPRAGGATWGRVQQQQQPQSAQTARPNQKGGGGERLEASLEKMGDGGQEREEQKEPNPENKRTKPTDSPKKTKASFLYSSGGEVQVYSTQQPKDSTTPTPTTLDRGGLSRDNEGEEDNQFESNSAILQRHLQRAKQILRKQKSREQETGEGSRGGAPAPAPTNSTTIKPNGYVGVSESEATSPVAAILPRAEYWGPSTPTRRTSRRKREDGAATSATGDIFPRGAAWELISPRLPPTNLLSPNTSFSEYGGFSRHIESLSSEDIQLIEQTLADLKEIDAEEDGGG